MNILYNQKNKNIISNIIALAFLLLFTTGCQKQRVTNGSPIQTSSIFAKGELGSANHFTGNAWNTPLVTEDSIYNTLVGNVYFEPGARSNWHTHPAGQILIITGGVGYHQIKGQPRKTIRKGDVVKCPPNVLHWHGASHDTGMQQLYILPKTEKGIVTWLQKVIS